MAEPRLRAIRGATTVASDEAALIREATRELLAALVRENDVDVDDIVSVLFTMTPDLRGDFPAYAARELGWLDVPLLCMAEIDVPGALPRCIRVLIHVMSARGRGDIRHAYLRNAVTLRPDLHPERRAR
jgi:chorismate mutase